MAKSSKKVFSQAKGPQKVSPHSLHQGPQTPKSVYHPDVKKPTSKRSG